jgi:EmrB/QacA subfamily drug resistance transporter
MNAAPPMTHRQVLTVMSGLMVGMLLAALDHTIVATALPTIVGELGGIEQLPWVVTAYLLTSTASAPLYGRISDLYGRKPVFQVAIVIFLAGSVLAGMSQEMWQLVLTRAIQGVGGGGLMALSLAIVADIVPPRERGRYQGYFGAVFGLSSLIGPLVGGFFVEHLSWRWIFYVNLPLGALALVVTSAVLRIPHTRREHAIDYVGAALLVGTVSSLLLSLVRGRDAGWSAAQTVTLAVSAAVLLVLFLLWEARTPEPILPLRLFHNRVFAVTSAVGFIVGLAMFGAIVFLPLYLQVVDGMSPTASGLMLLALMAGVLISSITSGRLITRYGRYKPYPVAGTGLIALSTPLLATLDTDTSRWLTGTYMLVLGTGLGMVMQVLVLAVQNSVDHSDLGVATSAATFFRSMGGTIGTAVFGAILAAVLHARLAERLPVGTTDRLSLDELTSSPATIHALDPQLRDSVVTSFVDALQLVFVVAAPFTLLAFALTWLLEEMPLRGHDDMHPETVAPAEPLASRS